MGGGCAFLDVWCVPSLYVAVQGGPDTTTVCRNTPPPKHPDRHAEYSTPSTPRVPNNRRRRSQKSRTPRYPRPRRGATTSGSGPQTQAKFRDPTNRQNKSARSAKFGRRVGGRGYPSPRAVLWDREFFFLLRTALKDRPKGPPTANHQTPPTANRQPPTTANCHQPPIPNHQLPPTTINRHQPPATASRQSPTANRQPPTHGVPMGIFGKPGYRNTSSFFFFFLKDCPALARNMSGGGDEKDWECTSGKLDGRVGGDWC